MFFMLDQDVGLSGTIYKGLNSIPLVDLVSDYILQMELVSGLLRKFGVRVLHKLSTNAICCTLRQLVAMPLST